MPREDLGKLGALKKPEKKMEKMKTTQWEKMIAVSNLDSRQDHRDPTASPIEVSGFDCHGRYFTERTFLANADKTHCGFQVRVQVPRDSVVAICSIRRNSRAMNSRPELFEVAHVEAMAGGWHIEATRLLSASVLSIRTPVRSNRTKLP
jgi:hypothetical protein